jgi:hypothetical protein
VELILVDTSVWVDHIRHSVPELANLVRTGRCVMHPYVLAEIALGNLPDWSRRVIQLRALPVVRPLSTEELLALIEELRLQGSGLGFVDGHLLGSCRSASGTRIWSRDKKLASIASSLGLAWSESDRAR